MADEDLGHTSKQIEEKDEKIIERKVPYPILRFSRQAITMILKCITSLTLSLLITIFAEILCLNITERIYINNNNIISRNELSDDYGFAFYIIFYCGITFIIIFPVSFILFYIIINRYYKSN